MSGDLIERLERATGPDRDLDAAVHRAAVGEVWSGPLSGHWYPDGKAEIPRYTGSTDAALTLVPAGLTWQVTGRVADDGDYSADVDIEHQCDSAPTPALALCIAALRARARTGSAET